MRKAKPGYKLVSDRFGNKFQIPETWKYIKIGHLITENKILEIQDGNHGELHPKSSDFIEIGVPFITADCLIENKIDYLKCNLLHKKFLELLRVGFAKKNDVLLSHKGSIGNTAVVDDTFNLIILSPQTTYYRLSDEMIPRFLYYIFQSENFQNQLKSLAKQSTRDYVGITTQKQIFVPYSPSKLEQQKIVDILSNIDNLIDAYSHTIVSIRLLKQGLMQQLLTKGIGHKKFKKINLFNIPIEIPENWSIHRLDDIGKLVTGSTPSTFNQEYYGEEFLWIKPSDIGKEKYITSASTMLSKEGFEQTRKLPPKTILVTCIGIIGKTGLTTKISSTNQQINSIICTDHDPDFIYYQVTFNREKIKNLANQSVLPILNKNDFGSVKLTIPDDIFEQKKIATMLSNIDSKINELESKKIHIKFLKKGLIQQLLFGKIQVNV